MQKNEQLEATTLHGSSAYQTLEILSDNLRRAVAMADVLNTAAFVKDVELPPAALQDFTGDLAALLHEIHEVVSHFVVSKT